MSAIIEKWIVGDKRRFGPTREYFVLIPRNHFMDEDWYFRLGEKEAVPASRLFDVPKDAALAQIKIYDETIRWANVQKQQMLDWISRLEAEKQKQDAKVAERKRDADD